MIPPNNSKKTTRTPRDGGLNFKSKFLFVSRYRPAYTFAIFTLGKFRKRTSPASFPQPFPQLCGKEAKNLKQHLKLFVYNILEEASNIETGLRLTYRKAKRKENSTEKRTGVALMLKPLDSNISDEKCINFTFLRHPENAKIEGKK